MTFSGMEVDRSRVFVIVKEDDNWMILGEVQEIARRKLILDIWNMCQVLVGIGHIKEYSQV